MSQGFSATVSHASLHVYTLIMDNDILASITQRRVSFLFFFEELSYSYSSSGYSYLLYSELLASLILLSLFLCAVPSTEIDRNVCFGSEDDPDGSFEIKQAGELLILRVDYEPKLPDGRPKISSLLTKTGR